VGEIAPALRQVLPGTVVRLAGQSTPETEGFADPPHVVVTGLVASMADELAAADVVIVPLLSGSGTRLKILEAMAHGVPVVSTTIGAEGLDVAHGVQLLIADTAEAMAEAVVRLQSDPDLRARLVENARLRFLERYEDRVASDRIHELVDSLRSDPGRGR
jgi:glycosyltransferase involved in cell wall biosynthesis